MGPRDARLAQVQELCKEMIKVRMFPHESAPDCDHQLLFLGP